MNNAIKLVLKVSLVAVMLWFLAKKGFLSLHATGHALERLDLIIPVVVALGIANILGALRWHYLLKAQNLDLKFHRTLQLAFIGMFFNIALPGAVSGDFVKAFYIGREIPGRRARAFGSILFDRVAGLSALSLLSAGALLLGFRSFWGTPLLTAIRVFIELGAFGFIIFYAYLFLVREHHDPLLKILRRIGERFKALAALAGIYEGLRHYHNHKKVVLQILAISICIHLIVGWSCLQFAQALGETQLSLLSLYVVVPLGLLVMAVPVLPAGVGTGHYAFAYLFSLLGSSRGADVFSLLAMTNIFYGAIGGLVYLRFRSHEPKPILETA